MTKMSFFDLSDRYGSLDAKKDPLVEINVVVPQEKCKRRPRPIDFHGSATLIERRVSL